MYEQFSTLMTELLKQTQYSPLSVGQQALVLFAVEFGYLDDVELDRIGSFESSLFDFANNTEAEFLNELSKTGDYNDAIKDKLKSILDNFKAKGAW